MRETAKSIYQRLCARLFNNDSISNNVFIKNLAWLGISEVFVRITRLVTAVVLARIMDPLTFGVAALVLTINELIRVFNRNGIGAKIVQCSDNKLTEITNTAYRFLQHARTGPHAASSLNNIPNYAIWNGTSIISTTCTKTENCSLN